MSLFNEASLVLIPSGYKAGKLYSEKPIDGDGDLTWTRNSTANRTNSSGVIQSVGANVPRLDYSYGSCPSALLEPQRTNSILNSTMDGAVSGSPGTAPNGWTFNGGGGLTRTISLGTENGLNYIDFRFQGTATQTFLTILPTPSATSASAAQNWNFSAYLKLVQGSIPNFRLNILPSGGLAINQSITLTSNLTRYDLTALNLVSGTTNIRPYFDTNTLTIGVAYDFTIRIAAPQLEQGAYATTYIPTTTASATRVADSFSRNNIYTNGLITSSGGTWFVELKNNVSYLRDNTRRFGLSVLGDFEDSISFIGGSNTGLVLQTRIAGVSTTLRTIAISNVKLAIKWNGTTADVFENGVKVVSATAFTLANLEFLLTQSTGFSVPTFIQTMALFPEPISDIDCEVITGTSYDSYSSMATALGYTII